MGLSSGEARRVLLTQVSLSGAKLLLLDEADDTLDSDGADLVKDFVRSADATALVVTHSLALARVMDVLWFIERGKVIENRLDAEFEALIEVAVDDERAEVAQAEHDARLLSRRLTIGTALLLVVLLLASVLSSFLFGRSVTRPSCC